MVEPYKISGRMGNQMFMIAKIYADWKRGDIKDIYCQDDIHFREYEDEIKALFGTNIVPVDKVAIHVRRGDYVDNPFYVDLTKTDYYEKAMAEFPDKQFLLFSDDIKWCKNHFGMYNPRIRYSEGNTDLQDFNLMAGCDGIIMANSSYSWWAAYLNKGKVIAPSLWYTDGMERTTTLDRWQKI